MWFVHFRQLYDRGYHTIFEGGLSRGAVYRTFIPADYNIFIAHFDQI